MVKTTAVIQNEAGIHCRPTAVIMQAAAEYNGVVTIIAPGGTCELGSALELMMLGLEQGTQVGLCVDGPNEEMIAIQFKELFERNFDFPSVGINN
jgi:phosphocarrier protein